MTRSTSLRITRLHRFCYDRHCSESGQHWQRRSPSTFVLSGAVSALALGGVIIHIACIIHISYRPERYPCSRSRLVSSCDIYQISTILLSIKIHIQHRRGRSRLMQLMRGAAGVPNRGRCGLSFFLTGTGRTRKRSMQCVGPRMAPTNWFLSCSAKRMHASSVLV